MVKIILDTEDIAVIALIATIIFVAIAYWISDIIQGLKGRLQEKVKRLQKERKENPDGFIAYMDKLYEDREDKDNIYPVGITDAEFRHFIIYYLLGEDWYVTDPLGQLQINEIALEEVLERYSRRYRKERKVADRREKE